MLPVKYRWLENIGVLPILVSSALQYLGVKEIPGKGSNPVIMDMADRLGLKGIYTNDDMSWCAVFFNFLCVIANKPLVNFNKDKYNLMRAMYVLNWGNPVSIKEMQLGDVVVLQRTGGGHVFILLAINKKNGNPIGIGGNQGDMVSIAEFDKNRIAGVRRFYATKAPESAKQYFIDGEGKISTNES